MGSVYLSRFLTQRSTSKKIHTNDHLFSLPAFLTTHLPFFWSEQKRYLPAPPTHGVWFHQATPSPAPLMLYDPPEFERLPHEKALLRFLRARILLDGQWPSDHL